MDNDLTVELKVVNVKYTPRILNSLLNKSYQGLPLLVYLFISS